MTTLTLQNIHKKFGSVTAVNGVDLNVAGGEFCVLLGPSGCGKSTLLQVIAGLTPQDRGTVSMDDKAVDRLSPRERNIAMVFQSYALYPHMSVEENLGFGLRMRGTSKSEINERVMKAARLLGIEKLLERKPGQLSGGQRQRVAMGRALVRRPRLFLMDEPLSNLDAQLRVNVRLELKRLHRLTKTTTIYVTHDQVEAMTLGDKIVVMKDGLIHQIGSPADVYERPSDKFVASFIGSPMMNFVKGEFFLKEGVFIFKGPDIMIYPMALPTRLAGEKVEIGIRPEDIKICPEGTSGGSKADVELISNMGSEKYIHAHIGKVNFTIRAPKESFFLPGESITLKFDLSRLNIFKNGKRV